MPHSVNLTTSLRSALPQSLHGYIDPIVKMLSLLGQRDEGADSTPSKELQIQVNPVSLGSENSYGDVSFADVAGGNIIKIYFSTGGLEQDKLIAVYISKDKISELIKEVDGFIAHAIIMKFISYADQYTTRKATQSHDGIRSAVRQSFATDVRELLSEYVRYSMLYFVPEAKLAATEYYLSDLFDAAFNNEENLYSISDILIEEILDPMLINERPNYGWAISLVNNKVKKY